MKTFRIIAAALLSLAFTTGASAQVEDLRWDLSGKPTLAIQLPGMSHHFDEPETEGRKFNETHLGIGLEWRTKWNDNGWVFKRSVGVMQDSLNMWGGYGGLVWQKELLDHETWSAELGGGVFLFYRALRFEGERGWVPAVLPALSIEHKPTKIGVNILLVPRFNTSNGKMPGVIYAQFTKRF